eukprot:TRINITY_DN62116_c0_g1_i1.p1 TRINITY_DN62116_c0_g1~~TRINITY_DN62116_c0_g1_i1.p1  ORF type:complete len:575 (+),score=72.37 TRINITY_DN62116_c0_g1_i1:161-1726(+)
MDQGNMLWSHRLETHVSPQRQRSSAGRQQPRQAFPAAAASGRMHRVAAARRSVRLQWGVQLMVAFANLAGIAHGLYFDGEVDFAANFRKFIGRYCYDFIKDPDTTVGSMLVTISKVGQHVTDEKNPLEKGKLYFLLFDDEREHWKNAWKNWNADTCEQQMARASLVVEVKFRGRDTWKESVTVSQHLRPRFWYATLLGCGLTDSYGRVSLRYQVHMTNDQWGTWQEFSFDRMRLNIANRIFGVLFVVLLIAGFFLTRPTVSPVAEMLAQQSRGQANMMPLPPPMRKHPYIKLLLLTTLTSVFSCAVYFGHFHLLMQNGYGSRRLRFLALSAASISDCTMMLVALLASRGWAISARSAVIDGRVFFGAITLVGSLMTICELKAETFSAETTRLYSYQSNSGVMLVLLKSLIFCWFAFQIKTNVREDVLNRAFYLFLGVTLSMWFVSAPITVALAFKLDPWVRYQVVSTVVLAMRFVGQAALWYAFIGRWSPISVENTYHSCHIEMEKGFDHVSVSQQIVGFH